MTTRTLALTLASIACFAQEADPPAHQKLIPTLWSQTSEEWQGLALQSFRLAALMLDRALADRRWTAVDQQGDVRKLPPAVILDVDETALDNSPNQAREVRQGRGFEQAEWQKWVAESAARAIPGALEFCKYADSRKVKVFYVTNRDATMEAATRANLARLGFPLSPDTDTLMLRGEKPEWVSDKASRRAEVAAHHRVLLVIGDDLNDFLSGARSTLAERQALMNVHRDRWGRQWIILPNPGYGSWEEALYPVPRPATGQARLDAKLGQLRLN